MQRPERIPIRADAVLPTNRIKPFLGGAVAYTADVYEEGTPSIVMENQEVRIIVAPRAGGRGFVFEDKRTRTNSFTTVGAMRDDVLVQPPPSARDYIAKYTHAFSAGTFNRPYAVRIMQTGKRAVVRLSYDAPDLLPSGAHFERTLILEPHSRYFSADEHVSFHGNTIRSGQRAVTMSSFALGSAGDVKGSMFVLTPQAHSFSPGVSLQLPNGVLGLYDSRTHELVTLSWTPQEIEKARVDIKESSIVAHLTYGPASTGKTLYTYEHAADPSDAQHKMRPQMSQATVRW
jgi:hypothetical protein